MIYISENKAKFKGNCILKFKNVTIESRFTLNYNRRVIGIEIPFKQSALKCFEYGEFFGTIGNKKEIRSSKICLSSHTKDKARFVILDDLYIGESKKNEKFEANLIGAYIGNANFTFKNLKFFIEEKRRKKSIIKFCNNYGNVLEGSKLKIWEEKGQNIDIEDCRELTKEVCILFSLISGTIVTFNRCETYNELPLFSIKLNRVYIWRIKPSSYYHATQCVNLHDFGKVMQTLLSNFHELNHEDKKCYYTVIEYLNSTSMRYLEDNILNIAQAWEIISEHFSTKKIGLSNEFKVLKSMIKSTVKTWKDENAIESTDLISNRLINSLSWDAVIKKIEDLADTENLNSVGIGLNFKKLIEVRNSIVHTGRFRVLGEEDHIVSILNSSILGLQVLILSKLGYKDDVLFKENGIWKSLNISIFKMQQQ